MKNLFMTLLFIAVIFLPVHAESRDGHQPSKEDRCPVCGMFVAPYADWVAEIVFADSTSYFFDGVKDLAKFYFNIEKYVPRKTDKNIEAIRVTEYYGLQRIDARTALYVIGSDVYGPMGKELIPLAGREDAEVFLKDHKGRRILRFEDITPALITTLD